MSFARFAVAASATVLAVSLSSVAVAVDTKPADTKATATKPTTPPPSLGSLLIKFYDKDKDGMISEEEFVSPRQKEYEFLFNRLDSNKNGALEESERKRIPNIPRADANADVMACIRKSIPNYNPIDDSQATTLKAADSNNDGKLSLAEVSKAVQALGKKLFASVDTNSNGSVNESELTAYFDQMAKISRVTMSCVWSTRKPVDATKSGKPAATPATPPKK